MLLFKHLFEKFCGLEDNFIICLGCPSVFVESVLICSCRRSLMSNRIRKQVGSSLQTQHWKISFKNRLTNLGFIVFNILKHCKSWLLRKWNIESNHELNGIYTRTYKGLQREFPFILIFKKSSHLVSNYMTSQQA